MSSGVIEKRPVTNYWTNLIEPSRPPSRGGNTRAQHVHVLEIDGQRYSLFALGTRKWAFKTDVVSFEYKQNGQYLNIVEATFRAYDRNGREVTRGLRGSKPKLRTALSRLPSSRREARD